VSHCPYHPAGKAPAAATSKEHIIPFAIGGSNDFTIQTCIDCNSVMGDTVDVLLVNYPLIQIKRLLLGLEGTGGTEPAWKAEGTADFQGKEVRVRYVLKPSGSRIVSPPSVEVQELHDGSKRYQIVCEASDARKILDGITKRYEKRGFKMPPADAVISEGIVVNWTPEIQMRWKAPNFSRPFAKMALGTGCFLFGDDYAQTNGASLLRTALWTENEQEVRKLPLHGSVWPRLPRNIDVFKQCIRKDEHFCLVSKSEKRLLLTCFLFGEIGGVVALCEDDEAQRFEVLSDGILLIIDPVTRRMIRHGFAEYLAGLDASTGG
jgi:hypothetical protein